MRPLRGRFASAKLATSLSVSTAFDRSGTAFALANSCRRWLCRWRCAAPLRQQPSYRELCRYAGLLASASLFLSAATLFGRRLLALCCWIEFFRVKSPGDRKVPFGEKTVSIRFLPLRLPPMLRLSWPDGIHAVRPTAPLWGVAAAETVKGFICFCSGSSFTLDPVRLFTHDNLTRRPATGRLLCSRVFNHFQPKNAARYAEVSSPREPPTSLAHQKKEGRSSYHGGRNHLNYLTEIEIHLTFSPSDFAFLAWTYNRIGASISPIRP